jgi:glycosyltransferase involved in cell wall biosynthesis
MKILWLCNIMLPKISASLGQPLNFGGGWLIGLSNDLILQNDVKLSVCFPEKFSKAPIHGYVENLEYYGFYENQKGLDTYFMQIVKTIDPDIIHIWGTEYSYTYKMVCACEKLNMLDIITISIQGMPSVYAKHFTAALPETIVKGHSLRDIIKSKNINSWKKAFVRRGEYEIRTLKKVNHIIGRTDWDKACTEQINANAKYHFCNETLRSEFYCHSWDINLCERHSIFISQCHYPIKGFHFMLEAMSEIIKRYPDAHIYTTGENPILMNGLAKLKQTYYHKYLGRLIIKYGLQNHVTFLGSLDESSICQRYLKSHVFVSPSSIENSPNSVGEAMLLGVPTVSSDVGGVKNMLTHNEEGYTYQYDAPYMLAYYVVKIFNDDDLALKFSRNAKIHAIKTHSREENLNQLMSIYEDIKYQKSKIN